MATLAQAGTIPFLWDWSAWVARSGLHEATPPPHSSTGTPPPQSAAATLAAASNSAAPADAFLNFGTSSTYPEQSLLTVGTAQPWFDSPAVTKAFGHAPSSQEQQDFVNSVVSDVQHTFAASGLTGPNAVNVTTDPNAGALHTLSVVSGLSYAPNPNAIGITDVGANGFGFIDKLAYATTPQDLEWAVAHNITHELMHAFGVAVHHDQTGNFLDAATANWSLLASPDATLSSAAVGDIVAHNEGRNATVSLGVGGQGIDGDQEILAPVPEPATLIAWGLAGAALLVHRRWKARGRDGRLPA
jgi:hypothetical protein